MQNNNTKKTLIITGIVVLLACLALIVVGVIRSYFFDIKKIYHVKQNVPYLVICTSKPVVSSSLESHGLTVKSRPSYDEKCAAFQLTASDKKDLSTGQYYAQVSLESKSGQKITKKEIVIDIVKEGQNDENTLSDEETRELMHANNSIEVNEVADYWRTQPIHKFVNEDSLTYDGAMWSIALRSDNKFAPSIWIVLNMPKPHKDRPQLVRSADQYKKVALKKIREWGVNPEDYKIEYKYIS